MKIPIMTRITVAFPAAAGFAIIIFAAATPAIICGFVVTGLGVVAYILAFKDMNMGAMSALPMRVKDILLIVILLVGGFTGLLAGNVARKQRGGSMLAAIMGIVGGAMMLGGLFIPMSKRVSKSFLAMLPFSMFESNDGVTVGIGAILLLVMLLWAIAAVISFCNVPGRKGPTAQALGRSASGCMTGGSVLLILVFLVIFFAANRNNPDPVPAGVGMITVILGVSGMILILPLGLAALAVGLERTPVLATAVGMGGSPQMMQGTPSSQARLQELQRLLEHGAITGQEYEDKRRKILESL